MQPTTLLKVAAVSTLSAMLATAPAVKVICGMATVPPAALASVQAGAIDVPMGTTRRTESGPVSGPAGVWSSGTIAVAQAPTGPIMPNPACLMSWDNRSIAIRTFC